MEKVSITITTDKPVKISVTPNEEKRAEENGGLDGLLRNVKEGGGNVVSSRDNSAGVKG